MLISIFQILLAIGLLTGCGFLFSQTTQSAQSALSSARRWGLAGLVLWTCSLVAECFGFFPAGFVDQTNYLAALLLMGCGIAVLGARRPGNQVWSWFVVFPMVLVLGWPCLFFWGNGWPPERFSLMTPAFLAVCLVLVMAVGNYLGTRFSRSAFGIGLACLLVIFPRTPWGWSFVALDQILNVTASALILGSIVLGLKSRPGPAASRLEHFWLEFRDWFGVVWASRVQERLNYEAQRLHWPFRFHPDGVFFPEPETNTDSKGQAMPRRYDLSLKTLPPETFAELQSTITWIFRRFVDPEWINARLGDELQIVATSQGDPPV